MTTTREGESGGSEASRPSGRSSGSAATTARRSLPARLVLFLRQVVAELKKVVRPTRQELITYTSVVIVFVIAVMLFVSGLDYLFGRLVLLVFGGD